MTVPFTYAGYEKMLKTLLDMGYQFKLFPKRASDVEKTGVIYLRHDVDISPWAAMGLAQVEHKLGICSSYFFMLDNPVYNLFSEANKMMVSVLCGQGHYVGPHIEPHHSSFDANVLRVKGIVEIFEDFFTDHDKAWIFSYHWGTRRLPDHFVNRVTAGCLNTYLPEFTQEIEYVSDSEGRWKYGDPVERAKTSPGKSMQILIHPEWWGEWEYTPKERLSNLRNLMIERIDKYFDDDILPGEWL